jgi:uncharacterized protein UPF0158
VSEALCALEVSVKTKKGQPEIVVALEDVVEEMDVPNDSWTTYLNRHTGEFVTLTDEGEALSEDEVPEGLLDRHPDDPLHAAEDLMSGEWLALPSKFDIHEYRMLERFGTGVEDPEVRATLLKAIQGGGAFRRFKEVIHEYGIAEAWYAYRQQSLEAIAVEWLDANGIAYSRKEVSRKDDGA